MQKQKSGHQFDVFETGPETSFVFLSILYLTENAN